jgi:hypothetical protein
MRYFLAILIALCALLGIDLFSSERGTSDCSGKIRIGDSKILISLRYRLYQGSIPGEYLMDSPQRTNEQYHLRFHRKFLLNKLDTIQIQFPEEMEDSAVEKSMACFEMEIPEVSNGIRLASKVKGVNYFSDSLGNSLSFKYLQITK